MVKKKVWVREQVNFKKKSELRYLINTWWTRETFKISSQLICFKAQQTNSF